MVQLSSKANPATETPSHETVTLNVSGMKCAGCVSAVEKQLTRHPGVVSACVNLVTQVATVECEAGAVEPAGLAEQLTAAGFPTQPRSSEQDSPLAEKKNADPVERQRHETRQQIWRVSVAGVLLLLSSLGHLGQWGGLTLPGLGNVWFHCGLAAIALFGPGLSILVDGWRGLRHNTPNMNTLVGLGALSAFIASLVALLWPQLNWECFFDEPVMLLGFILLGRALEQQARNRAAASFRSLLALQPQTARLIGNPEAISTSEQDDSVVEIPAAHVRNGEWLQVLPGEQIPVDGEVGVGQTTVDESMVTGEPVPVLKQPGDQVIAGTLNQSGAIALRATSTGEDTTLAHIIAMVETAQTRKAPIQRLADTVAGYFAYGVMAITAITFLFWYFIGTQGWPEVLVNSHASAFNSGHQIVHHFSSGDMGDGLVVTSPLLLSLKLAIAVLVIACPCALGLATPTAILVGTGLGAERGLLIRGGDVLEQVQRIDTLIFDKTGTLTTGQPTVTDCLLTPAGRQRQLTPKTLLQFAATVESGARHPLAAAIQQEAQQQELPLLPAQAFQTVPGCGVSADIEDQRVRLGQAEWLERQGIGIDNALKTQAQSLVTAGKTIVYVALEETCVGLIAVTDVLKPEAQATIEQLQGLGLRVMLLTGDQPEAAQVIAAVLDLAPEQVIAGVRPERKAEAIATLQAQGRSVAMVGDGINDAPALAQADLGIALRSGTDVATEAAQIVLMRDCLTDVLAAIRLSQATLSKIRQNLFWALGYNALAIPVAAGVLLPSLGLLLSPAAAGGLMAFSSVSVVTNSLLLRRVQLGHSTTSEQ